MVQRVIDDDTEGQRFTDRSIRDADPGPEDVIMRNADEDEDDSEGQKATHR